MILFLRNFIQVCQSSARYLQTTANSGGGDFVVHFGQIFPIQILQLPETLSLQVRKKNNYDRLKVKYGCFDDTFSLLHFLNIDCRD